MSHCAHRGDSLQPSEALLDSFPLSLTDPVSARARGAPLEGAATLALRVLSHRRRRPQVGTLAHEVWGVIALIRAHPNPLPTRNFAPTSPAPHTVLRFRRPG